MKCMLLWEITNSLSPELFIKTAVIEAESKNISAIQILLTDYPNYDINTTVDNNGCNIALHLGNRGNKEACLLFETLGARFEDFAYGAAFGGNVKLALFFIEHKAQNPTVMENYCLYYSHLAAWSIKGGHKETVHIYAKNLKEKTDWELDFNILAAAAVKTGKFSLVNEYLNKIVNPQNRDYDKLVCIAAFKGFDNYVMQLISHIPNPNFKKIAHYAIRGNHPVLARALLMKVKKPERSSYPDMLTKFHELTLSSKILSRQNLIHPQSQIETPVEKQHRDEIREKYKIF